MRLRRARPEDAADLAALRHISVREGAAPAYGPEDRAAWSPAPPETDAFAARLAGLTTLIAEDRHGPAGFASLAPDGRLDLFYLRPDRRRSGAAALLHDGIEAQARAVDLWSLRTEASRMLRSFLARHGWTVLRERTVLQNGRSLVCWSMEKSLAPGTVFRLN